MLSAVKENKYYELTINLIGGEAGESNNPYEIMCSSCAKHKHKGGHKGKERVAGYSYKRHGKTIHVAGHMRKK